MTRGRIIGISSGVRWGEALASASMDSFEMTVAADGDLPALVLSVPTGDDIDRIAEICQEADIQEWTVIPRGYQRSDAQIFVDETSSRAGARGVRSPGPCVRPVRTARRRPSWGCSVSP